MSRANPAGAWPEREPSPLPGRNDAPGTPWAWRPHASRAEGTD